MQKHALPMAKETFARVPDALRVKGIVVESRPHIGEFEMLGCSRDGVTVLLSMNQPPHWAAATDGRQELVIVAVLVESVFRFWRLRRERRLRDDILEVLRPLGWRPT